MALTFLSPCSGRMRSGLCWSSGIIRLMAFFWLNSKKVLGARVRRTEGGQRVSIREPQGEQTCMWSPQGTWDKARRTETCFLGWTTGNFTLRVTCLGCSFYECPSF